MFKIASKSIRELISKKYLDWAEALPKFQGGFVHELQAIREHQREWSRNFQNRVEPDSASLTLKQIRLVIAFQLEEFQLVNRIVSKLFPNSEKVDEFIRDLKKKESSIHASSWNNIGMIVKDEGLYIGETQLVDSLPEYVSDIHVSYHRIMPSLACLSFTFYIEDKFSYELSYKQLGEYLPPVIFNNINPFRKFPFRGYSMGGGSEGARNSIRSHIFNLVSTIDKWLESRIHLSKQSTLPKSIVERYELKGNSTEDGEIAKWFKDNCGWLSDYGISVFKPDSYRSSNLLYCESSYPNKKWPIYTLTSFENKEETREHHVDFKMDSLSVMAAIFAILDSIQNSLEKHRKSGFQYLVKFDKIILRKSVSVFTLKRLDIILNRLHHEFNEGKSLAAFFLREISDLKTNFSGKERDLRTSILDNLVYRIEALRNSSSIIDIGLTGYLEVQNIYAMYRLQRWMFILSIVVTLATIISVLSSWDNLAKLWKEVYEWFNKAN